MCMTSPGHPPGFCFGAWADTASTDAELLPLLFATPCGSPVQRYWWCNPNRSISPHVHAMPSQTPHSPAPLAQRRPSHGKPVVFVRPSVSSRRPTLVRDHRNPSVLRSKTGEAIVLVKPVGGRWMHRAGRFSQRGAVTLANQIAAKNSTRHIVLVKRVRGLLKCSRPINDTPHLIACISLEATP